MTFACTRSGMSKGYIANSIEQAVKWSDFVSIGLRDELRPALDNLPVQLMYSRSTWNDNMALPPTRCTVRLRTIRCSLAVSTPTPRFVRYQQDPILEMFPPTSLASRTPLNWFSNGDYDNSDPSCPLLEACLYTTGFDTLHSSNCNSRKRDAGRFV